MREIWKPGLALFILAGFTSAPLSQTYPARAVHICTTLPGTCADMLSRTLASVATGGPGRSAVFSDTPTIGDKVTGFVSEQYSAFWAPAKTPADISARLNQEARRVMVRPETRERLPANALEAADGTPEQLLDVVNSEVVRVSKLIKAGES